MAAPLLETLPQVGERYSFSDLFEQHPGYWVTLSYPEGLSAKEEYDLFDTPGIIVVFEQDSEVAWNRHFAYRRAHPGMQTFHFATELIDESVPVGGISYATHAILDDANLAYSGSTSAERIAYRSRRGIWGALAFLGRFWHRLFAH